MLAPELFNHVGTWTI